MSDLDDIREILGSLVDRVAALEDSDPKPSVLGSWGDASINDIDWLATWGALGESFAEHSGTYGHKGLKAFLGAVCDVADGLAGELEPPWASVFQCVAELTALRFMQSSYMADVPFERFIESVYDYLVDESNEPGDGEGVTLWEVFEAVAWGIDNVLNVGPLRTKYSQHGQPIAELLAPVALFLYKYRTAMGEGKRRADGSPLFQTGPTNTPPGGYPWSMPDV